MPQRLQDWYRYLEQQMHVSLPEGSPEVASGYRRGSDVLQHVPRNGGPRAGALAEPPGTTARQAVSRAIASPVARTPSAVPTTPRSPDPRRRGGRRPITETREEIIRRLLDPELTLHEAAAVLNLSKATVRRYTDQGKLVCLRTHGGQRRFHLSTLLAFLDRQASEGDA
jgi:excisionase family DNA binding protein